MITLANLGSPMHWFILAVVCLIVFGAKRLPDIARNIGKSLGELKKVRQEFEDAAMNAEKGTTQKAIVEPETPAAQDAVVVEKSEKEQANTEPKA
ncbi:MAG: twin-arginine translocase TatA/TatE family subunit [Akkermansia sp.]